MSDWAPKRFWTSATTAEAGGGYQVLLDGRAVKTPAKQTLIVPTKSLADTLAEEWDAQEKVVNPDTMPFTRLANSALDKVTPQKSAVADLVAEYGGSDLLCYRAEAPDALVARQAKAWDSLLAWAQDALQLHFVVQTGIMPIAQPEDSLRRIAAETHTFDPFALTAFHDLVSMSGSWVIGMAAMTESRPIDELWDAASIDEVFQFETWGKDEEALEMLSAKRASFIHANRFWQLCR